MLSVEEAFRCILDALPRRPTYRVPITRAGGEVLGEAVLAERDQPPFDRVTMDGVALRAAAVASGKRRFRSLGTQAAGAAARSVTHDDECIEVMTGTPLPRGADCVVPVERIHRAAQAGGAAVVTLADDVDPRAGDCVHARGTDYRAGTTLLVPGTRLGPPEMAVLASSGRPTVAVARRPRIAVLPTGDELVPPGRRIADHQIRRSNDFALAAGLRQRGFDVVAVEPLDDDPARLAQAIARHLYSRDVLVLSGGVSMGQFDHLPRIMQDLGVECVFHRIAQRPGRPMWFGMHPALNTAVFALPGNPVSSLVCLTRFVLPALERALGLPDAPPERVTLGEAVRFRPDLTWHLPVVLSRSTAPGGASAAMPRPTNTSGDFAALTGTAGFVELPAGQVDFAAGFEATLWRW